MNSHEGQEGILSAVGPMMTRVEGIKRFMKAVSTYRAPMEQRPDDTEDALERKRMQAR